MGNATEMDTTLFSSGFSAGSLRSEVIYHLCHHFLQTLCFPKQCSICCGAYLLQQSCEVDTVIVIILCPDEETELRGDYLASHHTRDRTIQI